jgi:hypothetical protein
VCGSKSWIGKGRTSRKKTDEVVETSKASPKEGKRDETDESGKRRNAFKVTEEIKQNQR